MKISAVYRITNTITGDFYIGSSKNVKQRWANHKCKSMWKQCPNNPMYQDMQKYGVDKFVFEILEEVEPEQLKEKEQQFIEKMHPTYNNINAKGFDFERNKKYQKEYNKSDKGKESKRKSNKKYRKSDKGKEYQKQYQKEYYKSERGKESKRKSSKKYQNQLCYFNNEVLTLHALVLRFRRAGIDHPTLEAKKYLLKENEQQ